MQLAEMKRDEDYHFRKTRSSNSTYHWEMYRKLRNYTNHEEKNLKSKCFCQMIEDAKGDDSCEKNRYSLILKSRLFLQSLCRQDHEPVLCVSGESIGKTISKRFDCFYFEHPPFHLDNVKCELKSSKSNKAVGLDKLSARLLKDASDVTAPILTGLINKSFTGGVFPGVWKCAKDTALFKDGDKSLKDNYRPMSTLPTISKIIERSAHIQLSSFLEENRLLSQSQFGFRLKRSTSTALIAFTDQVVESMDKGCLTETVFLDLRKAFDTVEHLLLINKLKSLGVAGKSWEWFRSYLSGRVQQTICVNAFSPPAKITMGVPQGSILGPLLFLVYINGIQSELQL